MHHAGFHPQRVRHNYGHAYEYSFVNDTKTLPSFSELTKFSAPPDEHRRDFDQVNRPVNRPLTFERVFDTNNYVNVVEVLDNKFRKLSVYFQTYHHGHYDDVKDSVGLELEPETELPDVVLNDIEPVKEEWLKFAIEIGKVDGTGPAIYQCLHYIEDKTDKTVRSTCNYKGLKQTVKRHVNSVHFKIRPWACKRCPSAFTQKSTLDIHINARHTQLKPHKCPHCPKRFKDPAKRHKHCLKDHPSIPMPKRRKAPFKSVSPSPRQVAAFITDSNRQFT